MEGDRAGLFPSAARMAAGLAEPVYRFFVNRRNFQYNIGARQQFVLPRPVISIGNLSTGGTGKTPVVAFVCRELLKAGHKPAVLMRGYKAEAGRKGDEQLELEGLLGASVPVIANPDRVAGAQKALDLFPDITVFVLDDGFQHRRVKRNFDLVLVSATQGLSGGHVLPRGMLREPPENIDRAHLVLLTRVDQVAPERLARVEAEVCKHWHGSKITPPLRCEHKPTEVVGSGGELLSTEALANRRVFAVAGTAEPSAFEHTLRTLGAQVIGKQWFPDHHAYTPADWADVGRSARTLGADLVVTTGKDAVKVRDFGLPSGLEVLTLRIAVEFAPDDARRLMDCILAFLKHPPSPPSP